MNNIEDKKIVITGGGSGGHTMTAISVIEEMERRNPEILKELIFVGGSLGMEGEKNAVSLEEKVTAQKGIKFIKIRCGKLQRSFSLRSILLLRGVLGGFIDAWRFFGKNPVRYVFSTGGYVATPVCVVAGLKRIPVIIHEQTTSVGLANKISSRFASLVLLGFESAKKYFSKKKTVFVGNTMREEVIHPENLPEDTQKVVDEFLENKKKFPIVFISGGGQGSHIISENVRLSLGKLLSEFQIILLTGDNKVNMDYDRVMRAVNSMSKLQKSRVLVKKFADASEMGKFYEIADLYVGRGGAVTICELGIKKTPSLLIPIPWVTHNEQYENAKVLENLGLAEILPEGELSPEILTLRIKQAVKKIRDGKVNADNAALSRIFVLDAAHRIVDQLEKY